MPIKQNSPNNFFTVAESFFSALQCLLFPQFYDKSVRKPRGNRSSLPFDFGGFLSDDVWAATNDGTRNSSTRISGLEAVVISAL